MLFPTLFFVGTIICLAATAAIFTVNFLSFRLSDHQQNTLIGCAAISHMVGLAFLLGGSVLLAMR